MQSSYPSGADIVGEGRLINTNLMSSKRCQDIYIISRELHGSFPGRKGKEHSQACAQRPLRHQVPDNSKSFSAQCLPCASTSKQWGVAQLCLTYAAHLGNIQ